MTEETIPILDLTSEVDQLWDELNVAIQDVLRSGRFIMGQPVKDLEAEIADYLGVNHAVGLNSGTDALVLSLRALGIGAGDEVITTPFTFFATAEAISLVGATPVFIDIDPETFNIDPHLIEDNITPRTRAVLPVHLYGNPADMDIILSIAHKHQLRVIEDAAQAFGAEYKGDKAGTLGHVGAFSFFPTKNLGAYGDGGMLATDDDDLAETARMLRTHGAKRKYYNEQLGYNSRLDSLQAAILRVKLPHVDDWNNSRREIAHRYNALLVDVPGVMTPAETPPVKHVYHQYTVRILDGRRDAVRKRLAEQGISTMIYYPVPIHKLPLYVHQDVHLPHAEQAAAEVLSLPMWPHLSAAKQRRVVSVLKDALAA